MRGHGNNKTITNPNKCPFPISKDELYQKYIVEKNSIEDIAQELKCSRPRIRRWMEYWGIKPRTNIEGMKIKYEKIGYRRGPRWRGEKWKAKDGQWWIYFPKHPRSPSKNNCVPFHIVAAEDRIGRHLIKGESVHHLDLNHTNNSPENLCVMTKKQHAILHRCLGTLGINLIISGKFGRELLKFIKNKEHRELVNRIYFKKEACVC